MRLLDEPFLRGVIASACTFVVIGVVALTLLVVLS